MSTIENPIATVNLLFHRDKHRRKNNFLSPTIEKKLKQISKTSTTVTATHVFFFRELENLSYNSHGSIFPSFSKDADLLKTDYKRFWKGKKVFKKRQDWRG